jgi:7-cyano-7-deazaguanine synthase
VRPAVALLSGGLDSATSVAWACREGFAVHALTVDYGQRHRVEVDRATALAHALGASSHRIVTLDLTFLAGSALTDPTVEVPKARTDEEISTGIPTTYVPARNTLLLALAMAWGETLAARDLVIGVNQVDYSGYPDCRPAFLRAFEQLARCATRSGVNGSPWTIHAPLLDLSKAEIVRRAVAWGVPYGATISCYDPSADGKPCGACDACRIRARGFLEAGVVDQPFSR